MVLFLALVGCGPAEVKLPDLGVDDTAADSGGGDNGGDSGGDNGGDSGGDNGGDSGGDNGGDSGGDSGGDNGGDNGGDTGEPYTTCSPWFPLDVPGATWTFQNGSTEIVAVVEGPARFEGRDASRVLIDTGSGSPLLQYYTCEEDGLGLLAYVSGEVYADAAASGYTITWDPPVLFTPRDLTENMTWSTDSFVTIVQGSETQSGQVRSSGRSTTRQTVTVPAGTFETIHLTLDNGLGNSATQYLAEGIGQIQGSVGELVSYDIP